MTLNRLISRIFPRKKSAAQRCENPYRRFYTKDNAPPRRAADTKRRTSCR